MAIAEAKPCPRRGPLELGKGLGLRCLLQWEEQFSSVSSWGRDIHPTPWEPWGPWNVHGGGAAEALTRVLGGTRLAGLPKPMGRACTAALRFGEGTGEGAGTGALVEGPVARAAHVGVHAHSAVGAHRKPPEAAAVEGALGVGAVTVHADARRLALIDVCRGRGGRLRQVPATPSPCHTRPCHLPSPLLPHPHGFPCGPACSFSPTQWRPPGASRKPGLQRHVKLPSSFRHTPLAHMVVVAHSLWSGDTRRGGVPTGSWHPLFHWASPARETSPALMFPGAAPVPVGA